MQGNLKGVPRYLHPMHNHRNKQHYSYFFLKSFWIESITSISLFTLHEYKKNRANYFWKFRNIKTHDLFSLSPIKEVIGYNILQEEYLNSTNEQLPINLMKFRFHKVQIREHSCLYVENNAYYKSCHWDICFYSHELEYHQPHISHFFYIFIMQVFACIIIDSSYLVNLYRYLFWNLKNSTKF